MDWINHAVTEIRISDFILIALSAIFTYLGHHLPGYIKNYSSVTPLLGIWHTYHWTRADGEKCFVYSIYKISRRIFGLRIDISYPDKSSFPYKGTIRFDGNDILLYCEAKKHKELWTLRLNEPISYKDTKMIGLLTAIDYDRNKYCTIKLCARLEKDLDEAKRIIDDSHLLVDSEAALRVAARGKVRTNNDGHAAQ